MIDLMIEMIIVTKINVISLCGYFFGLFVFAIIERLAIGISDNFIFILMFVPTIDRLIGLILKQCLIGMLGEINVNLRLLIDLFWSFVDILFIYVVLLFIYTIIFTNKLYYRLLLLLLLKIVLGQ